MKSKYQVNLLKKEVLLKKALVVAYEKVNNAMNS